MGKVLTHEAMGRRFMQHLNRLTKVSSATRTDQVTPNSYLPIPVLTADPPVTKSGQFGLYYNSSSGKVRKSYNGGAWTDTTI